MKKISLKKLLILTVVFIMPIFASNNDTKDAQDTIIVGTKSAPPFAMRNKQGEWEGISIELWKEIAKDLNLKYKFKEQNLTAMLNGVEEGSSNVAIAAITVTLEREKRFDFSHCYYTTGLTIATTKQNQSGWVTLVKAFFSYEMLTIIAYLATLLFIVGTITWLVERKKNKENFHNDPIKGIASGIWWAAVTMTTVGYGDMTPKTLVGRLIALFWMFASLLLVSSIIAGVTSVLTMANLKQHKVTTEADLTKVRVASVKDSVSDLYLKDKNVYPIYFKTVQEALVALEQKRVDAVVYDAALLKYLIKKDYPKSLTVTKNIFKPQNYAIALETNSSLKEPINRALLKVTNSSEWIDIKHKYLDN